MDVKSDPAHLNPPKYQDTHLMYGVITLVSPHPEDSTPYAWKSAARWSTYMQIYKFHFEVWGDQTQREAGGFGCADGPAVTNISHAPEGVMFFHVKHSHLNAESFSELCTHSICPLLTVSP